MNRRYSQSVLKLWGLAGGVVALIVIITLITATVHNGHINSTNHKIEARTHFWQVVAGKDTPTVPTVDNKLALDLRELINSPSATKNLTDFRGDSNTYGGVSDRLGIDPFAGDGCSECGPLTEYMKARLIQIKLGEADQVINLEKPVKPKSGNSWVLYLIGIWFLSIVPVFLIPYLRIKNRLKAIPSDQKHLLDKTNRALRELTPGSQRYDEIAALRDKLDMAVRERMDAGENAISDRQLTNLVTDLQTNLTAIEEGNKVFDE